MASLRLLVTWGCRGRQCPGVLGLTQPYVVVYGGERATARRREEQTQDSDLLAGLQALLATFAQPSQAPGRTQGPQEGPGPRPKRDEGSKKEKKGKGEGTLPPTKLKVAPGQSSVAKLLDALGNLCERARRRPQGLLHRLQALVTAAAANRDLERERKRKNGSAADIRAAAAPKAGKGKGADVAGGHGPTGIVRGHGLGETRTALAPRAGKGTDTDCVGGPGLPKPAQEGWAEVVKQGVQKPAPPLRLLPSAWDPGAISAFGRVRQALEAGKPPAGSIAWVNGLRDVEELRHLAKIHEVAAIMGLAVLADSTAAAAHHQAHTACVHGHGQWDGVQIFLCLPFGFLHSLTAFLVGPDLEDETG